MLSGFLFFFVYPPVTPVMIMVIMTMPTVCANTGSNNNNTKNPTRNQVKKCNIAIRFASVHPRDDLVPGTSLRESVGCSDSLDKSGD